MGETDTCMRNVWLKPRTPRNHPCDSLVGKEVRRAPVFVTTHTITKDCFVDTETIPCADIALELLETSSATMLQSS